MADLITKFNVYLGKSLFGIASKITSPVVDMITEEIKTGLGSYNVNTAVNAMNATITLQSFDRDVFDKIADPMGVLTMTCYGSLDTYTNGALEKSEQIKMVMTGTSKNFSTLGELEQQTRADYAIEFNISAVKVYINNQEKLHIDVPNYIFRKDGRDVFGNYKNILGLN